MTIDGVTKNALLVSVTVGTIANIEFSTGTVGLVQFEAQIPSVGPTRFERRQSAQELQLCRHYYRFAEPGIGTWYSGGSSAAAQLQFSYADMRPGVIPTLVIANSALTIADPGISSVAFSAATITAASLGVGNATINVTAGSGTQTGTPTAYHTALLITSNCLALSKEL